MSEDAQLYDNDMEDISDDITGVDSCSVCGPQGVVLYGGTLRTSYVFCDVCSMHGPSMATRTEARDCWNTLQRLARTRGPE